MELLQVSVKRCFSTGDLITQPDGNRPRPHPHTTKFHHEVPPPATLSVVLSALFLMWLFG